MPVDIQIPTSSTGRILRVFQRLQRVASRDLYDRVGAKVVRQIKARFKTKVSPEGVRWRDWSAAYAASRPSGKSLLIDEGDLEHSFESRIAGDKLQVFSTVDYAAYANHSRPFFGLSRDDASEVMDMIEGEARRATGVG